MTSLVPCALNQARLVVFQGLRMLTASPDEQGKDGTVVEPRETVKENKTTDSPMATQ